MTLQAVHDAEDLMEKCKLQAEDAREKLQQVSYLITEEDKQLNGGCTIIYRLVLS